MLELVDLSIHIDRYILFKLIKLRAGYIYICIYYPVQYIRQLVNFLTGNEDRVASDLYIFMIPVWKFVGGKLH